jgi:hypothetical protein
MLQRVNAAFTRVGGHVTSIVGTMWCALIFAVITLVALPAALRTGDVVVIVGWVAQTFLQLVLLSIIMVGQAIESAKIEKRDQETHDAVMAEHAETREILREVQEILSKVHAVTPTGSAE